MFFMNAWALFLLSVAAHFSGQGVEGLTFCSSNPAVMVSSVWYRIETRYIILGLCRNMRQDIESSKACRTLRYSIKFRHIIYQGIM